MDIREIDVAAVAFGFPMGPFEPADFVGLDIAWSIRRSLGTPQSSVADLLCERGWFGRKTGRGFYLYESGQADPVRDPEVDRLIRAHSGAGAPRTGLLSRMDIVERLIFPMINEATRILAEGVASKPGNIDVVLTQGMAFPTRRGGLMYLAGEIGPDYVGARLREFSKEFGDEKFLPSDSLWKYVS